MRGSAEAPAACRRGEARRRGAGRRRGLPRPLMRCCVSGGWRDGAPALCGQGFRSDLGAAAGFREHAAALTEHARAGRGRLGALGGAVVFGAREEDYDGDQGCSKYRHSNPHHVRSSRDAGEPLFGRGWAGKKVGRRLFAAPPRRGEAAKNPSLRCPSLFRVHSKPQGGPQIELEHKAQPALAARSGLPRPSRRSERAP